MNKITAIYVILNCVNGKVYLGSTVNFQIRRNRHISDLQHNIVHWNKHLQHAWNKYGGAFAVLPVEEFSEISGDALVEKEAWYIKEHDLTNPKYGYNIQKDPTDMSGENNPMFGKNHSSETKIKISKINSGRKHTLEARIKIGKAKLGKKHPNWRGGSRIISCAYCGKKIKKSRSEINNSHKNYCSTSCGNKARKLDF